MDWLSILCKISCSLQVGTNPFPGMLGFLVFVLGYTAIDVRILPSCSTPVSGSALASEDEQAPMQPEGRDWRSKRQVDKIEWIGIFGHASKTAGVMSKYARQTQSGLTAFLYPAV